MRWIVARGGDIAEDYQWAWMHDEAMCQSKLQSGPRCVVMQGDVSWLDQKRVDVQEQVSVGEPGVQQVV